MYARDYCRFARCQYPGHVELKKKVSLAALSLHVVYQTKFLYSSAPKQFIVPTVASWCRSCRIRVYPKNIKKGNRKSLQKVCQKYYQSYCVKNK